MRPPITITPMTRSTPSRARWIIRPLRWLIYTLGFLCRLMLLGWAVLAIYYSNIPWAGLRVALAMGFLFFGVWALWLARGKRAFFIFAGAYLVVMVWWSTIQPSHDRLWRPEVAVMPRAEIDGDRVRITGFRNFTYRSHDDFDVHYEEREFLLSHLTSLDFYISYWAQGPVGHTFVSFNFDNADPLCISIETRPEIGEGFDPIASLFKQFELIYVIGDERDLVGVRVLHRLEDVFLYRIRVSPEAARRLLSIYLDRVNELADRAEWYHLLSNNCTINIVRYANFAGRTGGFNIRHLLNGLIDRYLFATGAIDTDLPFDEMRRRSHINEAVKAADGAPDFSERIRAGLPVPATQRQSP